MITFVTSISSESTKNIGDKNYLQRKCATLDKQIDELVYQLYGLTEEEIKIVEGGIK
jgi:type II restriction/modification system DNA methylase subunit YeeA